MFNLLIRHNIIGTACCQTMQTIIVIVNLMQVTVMIYNLPCVRDGSLYHKANYCIIILLSMMITTTAGAVILSSPEVCCGDELEINCTVPGRVLEWTISLLPPEDTTLKSAIDSVAPSIQPHTQTVNNGSISFIVSRISPPGNTHPLMSILLISPATSVVNGTIVVCADRETRANSSIRVHIISRKLL